MKSHAAALVLYARQWCAYPDDAVQEVFIDLSRMERSPVDAVSWLYKTTRYKALNQNRAEGRRSRHQQSAGDARATWFVADPSTSLQIDEVVRALESLPSQQREIVTARVWGELSFAQIGDLVGLPTTTTFRIYQQTLQELQRQMEGTRASEASLPNSNQSQNHEHK